MTCLLTRKLLVQAARLEEELRACQLYSGQKHLISSTAHIRAPQMQSSFCGLCGRCSLHWTITVRRGTKALKFNNCYGAFCLEQAHVMDCYKATSTSASCGRRRAEAAPSQSVRGTRPENPGPCWRIFLPSRWQGVRQIPF